MMVANAGGCDESKCVSKGLTELNYGSHTCWGDDYGFYLPKMCSDGFLPRNVEGVPPAMGTFLGNPMPVSYFTCCPPDHPPSNETRQCSDPIPGLTDDEDAVVYCNPDTGMTTRQMKTRYWTVYKTFGVTPHNMNSFMCCNSTLTIDRDDDQTNTSVTEIVQDDLQVNFLDDTECVPYRNQFYEPSVKKNSMGLIRPRTCSFPEGSPLADFRFPRPGFMGEEFPIYQCCKNGPAMKPFVINREFKTTVYIPFTFYIIAACLSTIVVVGLVTPLLIQLMNGTYRRNQGNSSVMSSKNARSSLSHGSHGSHGTARGSTHSLASRRLQRGPPYSTYNLYLAYLSFFDLIYCLLQVSWLGGFINQKFNPMFYSSVASATTNIFVATFVYAPDASITYGYIFMNMWINNTIAYELLDLLKTSKRVRKMRQMSLTRANIQAVVIFILGTAWSCTLYSLTRASHRAGIDGDYGKIKKITLVIQILWTLMLFVPMLVLVYFGLVIWWGGYLPSRDGSTSRDKALRQLVLFFLRIVGVFFVIWFPMVLLIIEGIRLPRFWYFVISWSLGGIQPILTGLMILTKSDVRKYIMDLLTCTYLRKSEDEISMSLAFSNDLIRGSMFRSKRLGSMGTKGSLFGSKRAGSMGIRGSLFTSHRRDGSMGTRDSAMSAMTRGSLINRESTMARGSVMTRNSMMNRGSMMTSKPDLTRTSIAGAPATIDEEEGARVGTGDDANALLSLHFGPPENCVLFGERTIVDDSDGEEDGEKENDGDNNGSDIEALPVEAEGKRVSWLPTTFSFARSSGDGELELVTGFSDNEDEPDDSDVEDEADNDYEVDGNDDDANGVITLDAMPLERNKKRDSWISKFTRRRSTSRKGSGGDTEVTSKVEEQADIDQSAGENHDDGDEHDVNQDGGDTNRYEEEHETSEHEIDFGASANSDFNDSVSSHNINIVHPSDQSIKDVSFKFDRSERSARSALSAISNDDDEDATPGTKN